MQTAQFIDFTATPTHTDANVNRCVVKSTSPAGHSTYYNNPYGAEVLNYASDEVSDCSVVRSTVHSRENSFSHSRQSSFAISTPPVNPIDFAAHTQQPIDTGLPTALFLPLDAAPPAYFFTVQFKHLSSTFCTMCPFQIGDIVVVEGDRGENIGVITEEVGSDAAIDQCEIPAVLRYASAEEQHLLQETRRKELHATYMCNRFAYDDAMAMAVIDTEFQTDGNKLTIFYIAGTTHVDFRHFQRRVFKQYHCRIWLQKWEGEVPSAAGLCEAASR